MMQITHDPYWAKSAGGENISLYFSPGYSHLQDPRPVIIVGGVHGDEPEGVYLAEQCLKWLQKCHSSPQNSEIAVPWLLIPCINPDGYKRDRRVNANGVDLNRNYPSQSWSPEYQGNRYYPGPTAGSEPEIKSFVQLMQKEKPRLVIHCHSWEPCIVCTGHPGMRDAEKLGAASGYQVQESIGYPTPGSLSQWGWHDHQIPIICIEVPDRNNRKESQSQLFEKLWNTFEPAFAKIFADASARK